MALIGFVVVKNGVPQIQEDGLVVSEFEGVEGLVVDRLGLGSGFPQYLHLPFS